ncbi:MAG: hypothetical protein CL920_37445 [Deltaproteobacteria bacterium]|nr:hypothetical protein [Deltaproteobacteria bacterium]|tara:strand:- start:15220 stop:15879 length:660 start_codon:yes stop_codon:yes gene_type:complete
MKTVEKIAQAKACQLVLQHHPEHIFCRYNGPKLQGLTDSVESAIALANTSEGRWKRELHESNEALNSAYEKAAYYGNMLSIEAPYLEKVKSLKTPSNMLEKAAYLAAVTQLVNDHKQDLYFADEALDVLAPLESTFKKETDESKHAKEEYHQAVSLKDESIVELDELVKRIKRFVRHTFGIQSRQFQSLKNDVFTRPNPMQKDTTETPTPEVPTPSIES